MVQNGMKMIFRPKRSREKCFLIISWHFWSKKKNWKKKSKNAYKSLKMPIFDPQTVPKNQILILSNIAKKCMEWVFGNKKSPQKLFFIILGQKKNVFLSPKRQKNAIFRNFCGRCFGRKQTKSADLWPIGSGQSQSPAKIFFITNGQKMTILSKKNPTPPKIAIFLGGGYFF